MEDAAGRLKLQGRHKIGLNSGPIPMIRYGPLFYLQNQKPSTCSVRVGGEQNLFVCQKVCVEWFSEFRQYGTFEDH